MHVGRGRDDTLFALRDGTVVFKGRRICIEPVAAAESN
jgi:ribosomal protein L27